MDNKIRFKIDEKSLFYGVFNDYKKGQTATVSTPLNQSKKEEKWRKDILDLKKYNCKVEDPPEMLINICKKNSKSGNNIDDVFVFENILLDGVQLKTKSQFIMYIKRETDEIIKKQDGTKGINTHLGRLKLHYPISFLYKRDGYNIDNSDILDSILRQNGGFAFIVRGFEYDEINKTLNFITSLIGPKGIPLTTVFKRKKGFGEKLMVDPTKVVDNDYVVIVEEMPELNNTNISYELINKSRAENGKLGEEFIFNLLSKDLTEKNELYHTSKEYPQSPYDIEYIKDNRKQFVEVKATSGTKEIFNMSSGEIKFMEKYKDSYTLYMVTKVKDPFPQYFKYTYNDIIKMKKEYPTTRFFP